MTRRMVFKLFLTLIVGVVFCATVGCGNSAAEAKWPIGEERDMDAFNNEPGETGGEEAGVCQSDEDCGEDAYCHEPWDCTSPRYCADEPQYCSAAPGYLACGCEGRVIFVAAGCPGRHAWAVAFGPLEDEGAECDANAEFPVEWSLRFVLPEDRPADLLAQFTWRGEEPEVEPVPDDGILAWNAVGDATPDFRLRFLLDEDGDGTCSGDDQVWMPRVEHRSKNLVSFEIEDTVALRLARTENQNHCDFW